MSVTPQRALIASPHGYEHDASVARKNDRIASKPRTLRQLLRWAHSQYQLEVPVRMHSGALLEADGDPAMTGEARGYLGATGSEERATDWQAVACRRDPEGFYLTPLRCAIERIPDQKRRAFLLDLVADVYFTKDITQLHGIPDWCAADVAYRSLSILWDTYGAEPLPRRMAA